MGALMMLKRFFFVDIKHYIIYIICFSLCITSPGFTYFALSQDTTGAADPVSQSEESVSDNEEENEDESYNYRESISLINSLFYQQISELDRKLTERLQGADSSNLEPLGAILQEYQYVRSSVQSYLNNVPFWQRLREYCPYQEVFSQECLSIIESLNTLFRQDENNQFSSILSFLEVQLGSFLEGQFESAFGNDLASMEEIDFSSMGYFDYFALPSPLDEDEILKDLINKAFLEYLQGYCLSQESSTGVPTEDCRLIEGHVRPFFFDNNIMFIGFTLSIALKIILTQIYSGRTIDEIDFSPFTLSINQNIYTDRQITDDCSGKYGLS